MTSRLEHDRTSLSAPLPQFSEGQGFLGLPRVIQEWTNLVSVTVYDCMSATDEKLPKQLQQLKQ